MKIIIVIISIFILIQALCCLISLVIGHYGSAFTWGLNASFLLAVVVMMDFELQDED